MAIEQVQPTIAPFLAQPSQQKNSATDHLGRAVAILRRQARDEISSFRALRLLKLAEGIEDRLLPAVRQLEWGDSD